MQVTKLLITQPDSRLMLNAMKDIASSMSSTSPGLYQMLNAQIRIIAILLDS
jgi:hypothetical protein